MGLKFIDLFAGIGGFRLGMEQAGHKCVGFVEWDKFARKSYEAIHNTKGEWTERDITTISDDAIRGIGSINAICGGFPCQAFSVAGKRKGFEDTRGTLFFEIMRFASILRPRYLFLENVTGLLNHENGSTFETILRTLDEVGYDAEWDVLNSKDYGVPQNRERVFIVGHLRGQGGRKIFPIGAAGKETNREHLNHEPKIVIQKTHGATTTVKYDETGTLQASRLDKIPNVMMPNDIFKTVRSSGRNFFDGKHTHDVVAVLTPDREEKRQNGRRFKDPGEPMFTLTAQDKHGVAIKELGGIYTGVSPEFQRGPLQGLSRCLKANTHDAGITDGFRIRKLTPRECWRLQGFPDWAFDRAAEVNSDSQLYKQAGNSVTVNVIYAIASRLETL